MTNAEVRARSLLAFLDPEDDPQVLLRARALRRFSFLWMLLDQLPGGGWGKSVAPWMKENARGATIPLDAHIETEGGLETSVISFDIYCNVRRTLADKQVHDSRVVEAFGEYLSNHWDPATASFGTHTPRQEGLLLIPSLRHTALGAYGLLVLNQVKRHVHDDWLTEVLLSLYGRKRQEYRDLRNTGLVYLVMDYIGQKVLDPDDSKFEAYDPPAEVVDAIERWRKSHGPHMAKAFLQDRYTPIPQHGKKTTEDAYPFIVPYGRYFRMTTYSFLTACRFVTDKSLKNVRERMALGIVSLCKSYKTRTRKSRYQDGDPLKPTVRGIQPWSDADDIVDLGATAQLLAILTNANAVRALWGAKKLPACVEALVPLLHEDLIEQFDRFLIEPGLFRHTLATTLGYVLLVPFADDGSELAQVEDAEERYRAEHGLSEWSLNRIVEEVIFREADDLPTHIFARSLGRLLLDRTQPGLYPVGPLAFNGDPEKADAVIDRTLERYRDVAFAEKFDQVHGNAPYVGLADMFIDSVKERNGKRVIDVGCGPGQYAALFRDAGLDVNVLDVSPAMLSLARRRLGWTEDDPRAILADMREIERHLRGRKFHGIWCCSSLIHFPAPVAIQILRSFSRLLAKDGVLMVNTAIGNPRLVAEDGRFYAYWHTPEQFTQLLEATGFSVVKSLSTQVSRNVYWEPRVTIRWDSFFCRLPDAGADDEAALLDRSRDMTSTAYSLIVRRFYAEHGLSPSTDTVDRFLAYLPPGSRILDAGCGPGHYSATFWERGHFGVGLDLCPEMISLARQKHKEFLDENGRHFEVGDMCRLNGRFEDDSFEGVFCMAAFQHVPATSGFSLQTLKGFARLLKPGGVLLLDVQLGRTRGFEPDGRFTERYASVEDAEDLVKKAGFKVLKSGPATVLGKRKNAFKRAVELTFCNIIAQKPGELPQVQQPEESATEAVGSGETQGKLHFDGRTHGRRFVVYYDHQHVSLPENSFTNLLLLAAARGTKQGGHPVADLYGSAQNPYQNVYRLRSELKKTEALDQDADKLVTVPGDGFAYLDVSPEDITYDEVSLSEHSNHTVREVAKTLRKRSTSRP